MSFWAPRFAENIALTVPDYIVQNVAGTGGGGPVILLSNATVASGSSVGTVVGDFSISNGSTRAYAFSLTSGTSLFSVTNSTLAVAAALTVGSVSITAQASDTGTSVVTAPFLITVISTAIGGATPTYYIYGF